MSVSNNMEIQLGAVTSLAQALMSGVQSADLASVNTNVYQGLFSNGIATTLQSTLPEACKLLDEKGKKIAQLTTQTIQKEQLGDQQGQAAASGIEPQDIGMVGNYALTVDSSATDTDNDKDLKVRSDDEANKFEKIMEGLDAKSYISLMQSLSSMEKEELQNYLTDVDIAPGLKQWLLTSPKIDADLKQVIFNMDPQTVQTELRNILEGQAPLNDLTQDIVYGFTEMPLSGEMFENMSVATAEEMVEVIGDLTGNGNVQERLREIYQGKATDMSEANAEFLKSIVDTISAQTGINQTELLTNMSYANPITECLENVSSTFAYTETVSNYSGRSIGSLLSDMTKGV